MNASWVTTDDLGHGNHIEIWAIRNSLEDPATGVVVTFTDLDPATFEGMLERAARHMGYKVSSCDLIETRVFDLYVIQSHHQTRVTRKRMIRSRVVSNMPLEIRTFSNSRCTLAAVPCDESISADSVKLRRLELRMHAHARLVFETRSGNSHPEIYRAFIEIHDIHSKKTFDDPDLMRTVHNTVRVVFLGQQGKRVHLFSETSHHPGR